MIDSWTFVLNEHHRFKAQKADNPVGAALAIITHWEATWQRAVFSGRPLAEGAFGADVSRRPATEPRAGVRLALNRQPK